MRPPSVAKGDISLEMRVEEGGVGGWGQRGRRAHADNRAASKQPTRVGERKWRTSPGSPEGDVTTPDLVITLGNRGVKFWFKKSKLG